MTLNTANSIENQTPAHNFKKLFPRPGKKPEGIGGYFFWFLSSFWLAIFLLSSILVITAIATLYEAEKDSGYAFYKIYGTKWFEVLLSLLGVNVIAAAISRWPWKRRHTGFLITHLGLIVTLIGSVVSRYGGWEGNLALIENETGRTVRMAETLLSVQASNTKEAQTFPIQLKYNRPTEDKPYRYEVGPYIIKVEKYYPSAKFEDVVMKGGEVFNPAVNIFFQAPVASAEPWLILNHPKKNKIDFGPAQFAFIQANTEEKLQKLLSPPPKNFSAHARGRLHVRTATGKHITISLEENFRKPILLEGTSTSLTVIDYHENVIPKDRIEDGGLDLNPALRFALYSPSQKEIRQEEWLFYRLPNRRRIDFGGVAIIEMRVVDTVEEMDAYLRPQAFLERYPYGQIRFNLPNGKKVKIAVEELLGKVVPVEGTDLQIEGAEFYSNAVIDPSKGQLEDQKDSDKGKHINPALIFWVKSPGDREQHTLFSNYPNLDKVHRHDGGPKLIENTQLIIPSSIGSHITIVCGPENKMGYFCSSKAGGNIQGSLTLRKPVKTNWMDMELVVEKYIPKAVNRMILEKASPMNGQHSHSPAVRVQLESSTGKREYTIFGASFSKSFDTFPAGIENQTGIAHMEFEADVTESRTGNNLTIVLGPKGALYYVVKSKKHDTESGKIEIEKSIPLPWMPNAQFSVEKYIEKGLIKKEIVEASSMSHADGQHLPAIHVSVQKGEDLQKGWVWWDSRKSKSFKFGDERINISLYNKNYNLDFDVHLVDFRDVPNPGGEGVASFESDVDIHDESNGLTKKVKISMNNPLEYRNLLFFQSSFVKQPNQRDISVFSVSYDPGIRVVYTGFSLVCCGIFTMFYLKPYHTPRRRRKKKD